LEAALRPWIEAALEHLPPLDMQPVAMDGKSLCGTLTPHQRCVHLLALYDQRSGGVLSQQAVPNTTNEAKTALSLLKTLVLQGRLITADAMFCQRELCQQIVNDGGDYLTRSKTTSRNSRQPSRPSFSRAFPPCSERQRQAELTEARETKKGHGRRVKRYLQASSRLARHLNWPGLKQVCMLERTTWRNGKETVEIEYAITSLPPERFSAARILPAWVGHWGIENRLHWVRDVVCGEDSCRVRTGHAPQNLAAFRNAALSLLRLAGIKEILPTLRTFSQRPEELLKFLCKFKK